MRQIDIISQSAHQSLFGETLYRQTSNYVPLGLSADPVLVGGVKGDLKGLFGEFAGNIVGLPPEGKGAPLTVSA